MLKTTRDGPLVHLVLARPERRNALSPALVAALLDGLDAACADPAVGAVVLSAEGEHFCAGGDLGPGGMAGDGLLDQHRERGVFATLLQRLVQAPVPVVAAVQGDALGGGAGLVAACHLVVMADGARLSTPELKVGLFPWMIAPVLARKLPRNALHELVLCGGRLDAERALAWGLANRVVPRAQVLDVATALARDAAAHSPAIVRLGLSALAAVDDLPLPAALRHMHGQLSLNLLTEDAAEGISAFLARRPPTWKGR
ncbi:enoyl-CoA hydratase-related protein [Myxococcota bacterium]|nr:enoyl-CoA hydratase-related protein [Myxococcota bacterium]